jgi:hypothetical protein
MIIAHMESLEGGLDLVGHIQMSNSLKFYKRESREQSVSSLVVRIMELQLNRSDPSTLGIKRIVKTNPLDMIPNALEICRNADLSVWVIRPIEEQKFANTLFHVAFVDFRPIRVRKSLSDSDTI